MAILTRKTTESYPHVTLSCEAVAEGSACFTRGGAPALAAAHMVDGTPEVGCTLTIPGIGRLYLSPPEMRALMECRAKVLALASDGQNFIGREVRFSR